MPLAAPADPVPVDALAALSRVSGLQLQAYRPEHLEDRVRRALEREGAPDLESLVARLARSEIARARFRRSVAVSVSGLFRDPAQFALLEHALLPGLVADGRRLCVWSAGCADGSELYSAAMVLQRLAPLDGVRLLGSDLLEENLEVARRGVYGEVAVPMHLRSRARWERRDLVAQPPPPGRWSLVLCRNVAIYLTAAAKRALHVRLAAALQPGGVLLLGRSEWIADPQRLGLAPAGDHAYRRHP